MPGVEPVNRLLRDTDGAEIEHVDCLSPASFWRPDCLTISAWLDHAPFAFWLIAAARPEVLAELGTHNGFSYFAFCQAVKRAQLSTTCYAIDSWKGDDHTGFYGDEVFDLVNRYNDRHYSGFSRLLRCPFDYALSDFSDASIDLLHIDGGHRYEEVAHDFANWRPKLSNRAIVLFHNIHMRQREFGVWRLWGEIRDQYLSFEFIHSHGLGVLAVGQEITDGVRALFDAGEPARNAIRQAYAHLGYSVRLQHESARLAVEVSKQERPLSETPRSAAPHKLAPLGAEGRIPTLSSIHREELQQSMQPGGRSQESNQTRAAFAVSGSIHGRLPGLAERLLLGAARVASWVLVPRCKMADLAVAAMQRNQAIRLICATRQPTAEDFYTKTALGRSLVCYPSSASVNLQLFIANKEGLSAVYNIAIDTVQNSDELLVFLHDDLHLIDLFWADELRRAVEHFDIVGVVGNRRRIPRQPSWAFIDERLTWDQMENLSGSISHGQGFPSLVSHYGPSPQKCLLLDGLLLAARSSTLRKHGLRFDERFQFHFYDMDFCRHAEQLGVSMGTWPIAVVHESGGGVGSESWRSSLMVYFEKWGE